MHGHQSTGGGFRNIFNMVRGKVNDSTGRAMEGPTEINWPEKQNQVQDRSECFERGEKVKPRALELKQRDFYWVLTLALTMLGRDAHKRCTPLK